MRTTILFITFLLVTIIGYSQVNRFQKTLPVIDRYMDSFMKTWNIPGLALGIVYKDQLIYARGYGFRDVQHQLPVEKTTLFPIASQTKLFTATAACMLAGEGKLHLDQPVQTFLPSLRFSTEELNAHVTLRDMLSHRTGLPTYDAIYMGASMTRKELMKKVIYMKPQLGFREGFIYNNIMYIAAGATMEQVTGMRWEDIIRQRILQPLEMNASYFTVDEMIQSGNFAYSYDVQDATGAFEARPNIARSEAEGPEGTIISNVEDMSHWMIAQLNSGQYKEQQVIPGAAINQTLVPSSIDDLKFPGDELSDGLYALGRDVQSYKGYKITTHTGGYNGYYSNLTFLPSEGLAVFIIHNGAAAGSVRPVMALPVIDRLLHLSETPWSDRYRKAYLQSKANDKRAKDSIAATQVKGTTPSHALREYTGTYNNDIYGNMTLAVQDNQLVLSFRNQQIPLYHFHYDQFYSQKEKRLNTDFHFSFFANSKGTIDRFTVQFGDVEAEYTKTVE